MGIYDREYYRGETRGSAWFSGASPVCNALIVINVAVFLGQAFAKVRPEDEVISTWFAASVEQTFHHYKLWQLLTATFFHAGIMHLVQNMWFFWLVAREMEPLYGSRDFLAFYLGAGIFSSLVWVILASIAGHEATMIGASGAVTVVGMLFTLYYPKAATWFIVPMPMWMLLSIFFIVDLFPSVSGGESRVAVEAHLAGAAFGGLLGSSAPGIFTAPPGATLASASANFLTGPARAEPFEVIEPISLEHQRLGRAQGDIRFRSSRGAARRPIG